MDWSNERYVRIYVRDTKTWKLLGWEGQCVLCLLARRFDRSGLLDDVRDAEDVSLMIGCGFPVEIAEIGLTRILERGVMEIVADGLLWPNFLEAQEAAKTDKQRQREFRERRRAEAKLSIVSQNVTDASQNVMKPSRETTERNGASQTVTPTCAVPYCTIPTSTKNPPLPPQGGESAPNDFLEFWQEYPKKSGKRQALRAWKNAKKRGMPAVNELLEIIDRQKTWRQWTDGFVPNPATWLNGDRWTDEEPPTGRGVVGNQGDLDFLRRKMSE